MMDSQQVKLIQTLLSPRKGLSLLQDPPSTTPCSRAGVLPDNIFMVEPIHKIGFH